MPNGRPGDSRHHDIVHHRIETFGPACDALVPVAGALGGRSVALWLGYRAWRG